MSYERFLHAKVAEAASIGFTVEESEISSRLKPHQRAIVRWMVQGGRRACFAAFGLGKTVIQLETVRITLARTGGRGLIVCPLGVRAEFRRDAVEALGWETPPTFIRSIDEAPGPGIYLTNYETVRDGKLDPNDFEVASLDEAAILRGFGGTKTFRQMMALFAGDDRSGERTRGVPYRFVATATPSPNEYIELLAYAAYLDVMDVSAAKTRFFKRDSTKADNLTIHPHKVDEFWQWVAAWAVFVQRPSDLGPEYSDEGYDLPALDVRWHEIPTDHSEAGAEKDGQSRLFKPASLGVVEASREKRSSLSGRIAKLMEIRAEEPDEHRVIWHDLEDERRAIEEAIPSTTYGEWEEFRDGHPIALEMYERHYSAYQYKDGRERKLLVGPGQKLVLLSRDRDALFVWRKFIDDSGQTGVNCAVFRSERSGDGDDYTRPSELIKEAMAIAWLRWPGERLYTYVDPDQVRSANPGFCFLRAGWNRAGETKGGNLVLEALPGCDVPTVTPVVALRSVYGSQDLDEREQAVADFAEGRIRELAAKPVMLGSGCNLQRHCARAVFLGIGFKFADWIQAVHRIRRFLQTRQVRIDLIYTEAEREVRAALEEKWRQHEAMVAKMSELIREQGLAKAAAESLKRAMHYTRTEVAGEGYRLILGDAIEEVRAIPDQSVGLIVTSIPFSTQYEYSPSYRDLGHTDNNEHFFEHLGFLTPHLLRVLQPGRVCAVHVKDRITPGGINGFGFQTVEPFSDQTIAHFRAHGFAFIARKTVVTDVVRENNQTYRLGWTEQCKDGSRMGAGMPEYVLLFRAPQTDRTKGYADIPVVKTKAAYTRARWQFDAHGFTRSSGNRLLAPGDLDGLAADEIFQAFRRHSIDNVYDFARDLSIAEDLDRKGMLPPTFMLLQPQSWHPDVWTDITRMRTLNALQAKQGKEMHLCPLQFDIVDRLITQFSMEGETVFDPFGGIMTVPLCAVKLGRVGVATELNAGYFADGAAYVEAAAKERSTPTLFDLFDDPAGIEAGEMEEAS